MGTAPCTYRPLGAEGIVALEIPPRTSRPLGGGGGGYSMSALDTYRLTITVCISKSTMRIMWQMAEVWKEVKVAL